MLLKFNLFVLCLVVVWVLIVVGGFVVISIGWVVGGGFVGKCDGGGFVLIIEGEWNCFLGDNGILIIGLFVGVGRGL